MEKWAAIDIGSNTVQLLVAQVKARGQKSDSGASRAKDGLLSLNRFTSNRIQSIGLPQNIVLLFHALRTTRLGACRQPGLLEAERIAETVAVLEEYKGIIASHGVSRLRVVATSAIRDALNRRLLLDAIREQCGWQVEVLSGQQEARLSFWGASAAALDSGFKHILLLDIGGSSSELIRWDQGCLTAQSFNMGAVRAQTAGWQAAEIESRLAKELKKNEDDKTAFAIGAGGTITTAAALVQGHQEYNRASVAGYSLKIGQVEELLEKFQSLSISQRCAFSPLLSRRGEIICEGLMIVGAFCRLLSLSALTVSAGGVLEGCLMELGMRNEE